MRRWHLLALLAAIPVLAAPKAAPDPDAPPGSMYQHQREQGEDSSPGRIWREGGLTIRYDIGGLAGNMAEGKEPAERAWTKQQVVDGRRVDIVKTKDGVVIVSFPFDPEQKVGRYPANFFATIKNDDELADLLLTALTYPAPPKPAG